MKMLLYCLFFNGFVIGQVTTINFLSGQWQGDGIRTVVISAPIENSLQSWWFPLSLAGQCVAKEAGPNNVIDLMNNKEIVSA